MSICDHDDMIHDAMFMCNSCHSQIREPFDNIGDDLNIKGLRKNNTDRMLGNNTIHQNPTSKNLYFKANIK